MKKNIESIVCIAIYILAYIVSIYGAYQNIKNEEQEGKRHERRDAIAIFVPILNSLIAIEYFVTEANSYLSEETSFFN